MKVKRLLITSLYVGSLALIFACGIPKVWAGCGGDCGGSINEYCNGPGCHSRCGLYSCGTNADTSPSICDSGCPDPCDLRCDHDNVNYRGCGNNCVEP